MGQEAVNDSDRELLLSVVAGGNDLALAMEELQAQYDFPQLGAAQDSAHREYVAAKLQEARQALLSTAELAAAFEESLQARQPAKKVSRRRRRR